MQSTKVIDVSRGFVPVDPNAYPETLHGTGFEDEPEKRVPVIPYKGHNFLPTGYGVKSFFGTNAALGIDALAPNKPDHVFMFQNLAYANILIALCDTGIWLKAANAAGAWTQAVALTVPDEDTYYEWFFTTIKNKLYAFRANGTAYYKIETDLGEALGISVEAVVPTFITVAAQLGMFRLGYRLGFWDGENAVAYSSPDDLSDFTPNVLSGANVTTFNSVIGKISNVRAHGNNAVVYASKSIVGLQVQAGETFFVRAVPILQDTGVPYAKQSVATAPDNVHFAYTSTGIYKIEDGKPELIVPEVFDYFKKSTAKPIYLRFLQGRYLCFEILHEDTLNGVPQFSVGYIPEDSLVFPGYTSLDQIHDEADADSFNFCGITPAYNAGTLDEQKLSAESQLGDKKLGTVAQPLYTAYLSNNMARDPADITWEDGPCAFVGPNGTAFTMAPGNVPKSGDLTIDSTNKTASYGPDAWIDGKWTMERFIQTQSAIWKLEDNARERILQSIINRAFNEVAIDANAVACAVANTTSLCEVGTYPSKYSAPQFAYNGCSFWLTRYLIEEIDIRATLNTVVACEPRETFSNWASGFTSTIPTFSASYNTAAGILVGVNTYVNGDPTYNGNAKPVVLGEVDSTSPLGEPLRYLLSWSDGSPFMVSANRANIGRTVTGTIYTKTTTANAYNEKTDTNQGVLGVETAYCELTHWKYEDVNGNIKIVPATACTNYSDSSPGAAATPSRTIPFDSKANPISADGSVCGAPFEVPELIDFNIDWPSQSITYPASTFLLQDGGIAPKYPDIYGFFCYDLHLKKWGKAKLAYKCLLDYSPINSESSSPVDFSNFGMLAGVVKDDGLIYIFDDSPTDSEITWGKIGYYRHGKTDLQSVRFDFASVCSGNVYVDISLDGQQVVESLRSATPYAGVRQIIAYPPYSADWFNITLSGKYDVSYAEVNMLKKGRR